MPEPTIPPALDIRTILANIRRLLQIPFPDLQVAYHEDALARRRYVGPDDSEIEMLRHLIHVELDKALLPPPEDAR